MIEVSRVLLRRFRAVVRRSLMDTDPRGIWPVVVCRADGQGLSMEAHHGDLAVRHRQHGNLVEQTINFPGGLLTELQGRSDQPVALDVIDSTKGKATWLDGAVPRAVEFDMVAPDTLLKLPEMPKEARELSSDFLTALGEAARTTAKDRVRFALTHVRLRGGCGEVVATDGKQLLVQAGFDFPWQDDALVQRLPVFGSRDVTFDETVRIGRARDVILLETGPWTFLLRIDKEGRFPKTDQVIPSPSSIRSRLCLDPKDAAFLAEALPRLPGTEDDHSITLDLCNPPCVRCRQDAQAQVNEVVLARSSASGKQVRVNLDRRNLYRALKLSFIEIQVAAADVAVTCRDRTRVYVFMPLSADLAIGPTENALRIPSAEGAMQASPISKERMPAIMPPQPNGNGPDNAAKSDAQNDGAADVITEAESLRDLLHVATARTARLVAALKHQRRQTRAVQQAMQSLRQLHMDR
jgi:hypothetical protein